MAEAAKPMSKKQETNMSSVFVRNLPFETTDAQLEEHFSDVGPLKEAYVICDKKTKVGRGFAFVSYVLPEDAQRAVATLNGSTFQGRKITVDSAKSRTEAAAAGVKKPQKLPTLSTAADAPAASPSAPASASSTGAQPSKQKPGKGGKVMSEAAEQKALRLIVRNLSFRCDEAALRKAFEKHGTVVDTRVPMKPDGKHPGFGFVQMSTRAECDVAMEKLNEQKIVGRMVAVDYALSKHEYEKQSAAAGSAPEASEDKGDDAASTVSADDKEHGADVCDESEDEDDEEDADEKEGGEDNEDSDNEDDDDEDEDERESSEGDEEDDAESEAKQAKAKADVARAEAAKAEQVKRTVFLRGLPLQATAEHIKAVLGGYGKLQYATVVRDAATKLSKGTAFACFAEVGDCQAALKAAGGPRGGNSLAMLGQTVNIAPATDKRTAESEAEARRQEGRRPKEESRRNMHLARLGLTLSEDSGFDKLPINERRKREDAWKQKREKLASPNFIVSDVRLSVRGLPPSVDEDKLREIAMKAAGGAAKSAGKPKLKQVKIIRDEQRLDQKGVPRSRGFGFVHFESHAHALAALKGLSDNPEVLPDKRLLLVEFAVDNVQKLKMHEKREERGAGKGAKGAKSGEKENAAGAAAATKGEDEGADATVASKRLSRGQRQRARKRAAAEAAEAAKGESGDGGGPEPSGSAAAPAAAPPATEKSAGGGKTLSAAAAAAPSKQRRKRSRTELVNELAASAETALPAGAWSAPAKAQELAKAAKGKGGTLANGKGGGTREHLGAREGAEVRAAKRKRDAIPELEIDGPTEMGGKRHQLKMSGRQRLKADEDRFEALIRDYKSQV